MNINERVAEIRKYYGLTQADFGAAIGLTGNYIWMIEKGRRPPSDRTIMDLCREFDINPDWLKTGSGEMIRRKPRHERLMELCLDAAENPDSPKGTILAALAALSDEQWQALGDIIKTASAAVQTKKKPDQD